MAVISNKTLGGGKLQRTSVTVTFDGNANTGAIGNVPLFTITGTVDVALFVPICTTTLGGATATLALGVTGATALFIAATTATTITSTNMIWMSTTPTAAGLAVPAAMKDIAITANIVGTVATAAVTSGVIRFDVYWMPMSSNGLVA